MKKNIKFKIAGMFLFLLTTFACKSQTVINITERCNIQTNDTNGSLYIKDINNLYDSYVGTWKWQEGNRELILTLIKQEHYHYFRGIYNYHEDRIVGFYVYKENGNILINTITTDDLQSTLPKVKFKLDCYSQLVGTIQDPMKNKIYYSMFEIISPTQIRFKGKDGESNRVTIKEGRPRPAPVFPGTSFPLEMILIKQ
jgi:hypothetical protein